MNSGAMGSPSVEPNAWSVRARFAFFDDEWVGGVAEIERIKMKLNIGLKDSERKKVVSALNGVLANEIALTQATRGAHWNVVGPSFGQLHALFGEQYDALNATVDEIAERIRTLGAFPETTLAAFAKAVTIDDSAGNTRPAAKMIGTLLAAHESLIGQLGKAIEVADAVGDSATEDFLVAVMAAHQKTAWILRAHLE